MILCLDVGNGQIYGGLYEAGKLKFQFRKRSTTEASSDELGMFLRQVLRENDVDPDKVSRIAICSVVPDIVYSLRSACIRYFDITPFMLGPGVRSGLKIKYRNPLELGADRIANCVAGIHRYPNRNLIIIDTGTAMTFCAVSKEKEYLGGAIVAGMKISMEALESKTARLPSVEIIRPSSACGRSTTECIQSGLFFGNIGMIKELSARLNEECFGDEKSLVLGTGGFSGMFADYKVFDEVVPDLVLSGIHQSLLMNS